MDGESGRMDATARPEARAEHRLHRWSASVRLRSAVAAAAVVAVALLGGAVVIVLLLERSLVGAVETTARARADEVARLVDSQGPAGLSADLQVSGLGDQVVQVIGPDGQVVASGSARLASTPISDVRPAVGQTVVVPPRRIQLLDPDDDAVLVVEGAVHEGRRYTVVVGADVAAAGRTVATTATLLAIAYPVLLLVVGGSTFWFVGRTLRPVERIRARVAGIGAGRMDDRVPVPNTHDEIARLALTMNAMLDRLQEAHHAQQRFVADASHELRSPIATLRASLEVSAADPTGASWQDLSGPMSDEVERMGHLVEDLLLLARADERGLRLELSDVDLDDLVEREARRLRTAGTLRVRMRAQPARVTGDPVKLTQALRNLVDNAARHAAGQVELRVRVVGAQVEVTVDDDGPGIPGPDRERVFDRFVRLDSSRQRASGGSGLGLAIVREIVRGHGGSVRAEPSPLGGARLVIDLPAVEPSPVELDDELGADPDSPGRDDEPDEQDHAVGVDGPGRPAGAGESALPARRPR